MGKKYLIALFISCVFTVAHAQENNCHKIKFQREAFLLDSLSVNPESIVVTGPNGSLAHTYDLNTGEIRIHTDDPLDSVKVCYTKLPFSLHQPVNHNSFDQYYDATVSARVNKASVENSIAQQPLEKEELFSTGEIQKQGSLSRGVAFGNTQDVVVTSALNLQLEGPLTDGLNIRANITDQQIPYQPEGNSARIQDLDKVFIELYNEKMALKAGDVLLTNNPSHFLKYRKNVQGVQANAGYHLFRNDSAYTNVGVAVAKGKFASIKLDAKEGEMGPYRLLVEGASDLIIIMAGSEKVYFDGQLLQRGYDNDYMVDYNKAEITFTANVPITKYSRINVDFEYSDLNYSRSITTFGHDQTVGRVHAFVNYYSEKDNKNKPLSTSLSDQDKILMSTIGNDTDLAFTDGAKAVDFNPDAILYARIDTIDQDGQPTSIYALSYDNQEQLFQVGFSRATQGNYVVKPGTANGRVFEWVSPQAGVPQGEYEPVKPLPVPNKKQMINAGVDVDVTDYESVHFEMAFSDHDQNLYSNIGNAENKGAALRLALQTEDRKLKFLRDYSLTSTLSGEYTGKGFNAIDRYRDVEFDRNWSYRTDTVTQSEEDQIYIFALGMRKNKDNFIDLSLAHRNRGNSISGWQQQYEMSQEVGGVRVSAQAFLLNSASPTTQSQWQQLEGTVAWPTRYAVPSYTYRSDKNVIRDLASDSITGTQMNYDEHSFGLKTNDTLKLQTGVTYSMRTDNGLVENQLAPLEYSNNVRWFLNWNAHRAHDIDFSFFYRDINALADNQNGEDQKVLMGRANWQAKFFKGNLQSDFDYMIGNSRELRRDFSFIKVPTGEGTHTWRDDNGDGIQDLGEFYLAVHFDERNFIKVFLPSNEYVDAYQNNFNYRLNARFPTSWQSKAGLMGFLSRISANMNWNILRKTTDPELASRIIPFVWIAPENILAGRDHLRATLFFNRANPSGLEVGLTQTGNRQLHSNGFELRNTNAYYAVARQKIGQRSTVRLKMEHGITVNDSDFLLNKNYTIKKQRLEPEISFSPSNNWRVNFSGGWADNKSESSDGDKASHYMASTNMRYSKAGKSSFSGRFSYVKINFEGEEQTPAGYELLEALNPGQNMLWSITWQQQLIKGLQMTINYEGRSSETRPVIHTGRMQITALF